MSNLTDRDWKIGLGFSKYSRPTISNLTDRDWKIGLEWDKYIQDQQYLTSPIEIEKLG